MPAKHRPQWAVSLPPSAPNYKPESLLSKYEASYYLARLLDPDQTNARRTMSNVRGLIRTACNKGVMQTTFDCIAFEELIRWAKTHKKLAAAVSHISNPVHATATIVLPKGFVTATAFHLPDSLAACQEELTKAQREVFRLQEQNRVLIKAHEELQRLKARDAERSRKSSLAGRQGGRGNTK